MRGEELSTHNWGLVVWKGARGLTPLHIFSSFLVVDGSCGQWPSCV
jgi:hypothetical protein